MMGIARNRQVAITPGKYTAVKNIEIPQKGKSFISKISGK
jgi:hypothetical protein